MLRYSVATSFVQAVVKKLEAKRLLNFYASKMQDQNRATVVKHRVLKFLRDDSGATAIEYGLIAAGIAVAIITVVKGIGPRLNTTFTSLSSALK
jgi:pilus assembly protein Flp/PilA